MGSIKPIRKERQIMKSIRLFVLVTLILGTLLLSACGAAAAATPTAGSDKAQAMPVAFVGTVQSIDGNQWVISGSTVTVDPKVVHDGPFSVGDQVKVEGAINPDGSFTVSRVEVPAPEEASSLPGSGNDNSNDANLNDDNGNDANLNETEVNDDHGNDANINDDHGGTTNTNDDNTTSPSNSNTNDNHGGNSGKDKGGSGGGGDK